MGVGIERGGGLVLNFENVRARAISSSDAWGKKIVAHVGTGKIDFGADLFEGPKAAQVGLPNAGVVAANAFEQHDCAKSSGEDEEDQATEACGEDETRTETIQKASVMEIGEAQNPVTTG